MSTPKRLTPCTHYICKGKCELNKDASHSKQCQICKSYKPRSKKPLCNGKNQKHAKAKKLAEIRAKEEIHEYNSY